MINIDAESNFTEHDINRIADIKESFDSRTKEYILSRADGKGIHVSANPTTIDLYGEEALYAEVRAIFREASANTTSFTDVLANIYKMQGYSKEELIEDMKSPKSQIYLSNIIDMELQERFARKIGDIK